VIEKLDLKNVQTVKYIIELQKISYKIEAEIIGFDDIPPLKDTIERLQGCDEIFYGYKIGDSLAGIISYKVIEDALDIHRIAIHPSFFRKGIANKMINFVEELESNVKKVIVCTGKENLPAVNLYLKNGYKKKKDIQIRSDVYITEFEKIRI